MFAESINLQYGMFLSAVRGGYLGLADTHTQIFNLRQIERDFNWFKSTFLANVKNLIAAEFSSELLNVADSFKNDIEARRDNFIMLMDDVASGNIKTAIALAKGVGSAIHGVSESYNGAIGQLMHKRAGVINYRVKDSSGRNWISESLIKFLAKDFEYQTSLDITLGRMLVSGIDMVEVVYSDVEHENNGLVFYIGDGESEFKTLSDIRSTIFHPNATAMVKPYVHS